MKIRFKIKIDAFDEKRVLVNYYTLKLSSNSQSFKKYI